MTMQTDLENRRFGAIEAGGTKTVCAIANGAGAILAKAKLPTEHPEKTLAGICDFFKNAVDGGRALSQIGVAAFGPVDIDPKSPRYGAILATPKPDWTGASFVEALSGFKAPVIVDTDVNGAGLGEWLHGAGLGTRTLAYVTVGTGIGAGVLKDGRSLGGFGHYEMGHIRPPHDLARDPFPGRCPFHGDCIEGLACGPAIIDRWGAPLHEIRDEETYARAIDLEAEYLAYLASTIIFTHMPDRIIFGGGVMKAEGLIEKLREKTKRAVGGYVQSETLNGDLRDYIVAPALGDDAGITGAVALALAR
ncbi:MAG: ROK family protein [Pseudomonadota bacterium]